MTVTIQSRTRKLGFIAFAVAAAVGFSGCGAGGTSPRVLEGQEALLPEEDGGQEGVGAPAQTAGDLAKAPDETTENKAEAEAPGEGAKGPTEADPVEDALAQYRIIVSQAESYVYGETLEDLETTGYQYALVQMLPNDPVPTLLLQKQEGGWTYVSHTRIFQYNPDTKNVCQPEETIAGGIRSGLNLAEDGIGILDTAWSGGTGKTEVQRITLYKDSLNRETYWRGRIDLLGDEVSLIEIEWHETGDLTALDRWEAPPEAQASIDRGTLPTDGDRIVLTGTVGTYDYDEIVALQKVPDPNAFDASSVEYARSVTYHVIVLDEPQYLRLRGGDGEDPDCYITGEVLMINLFDTNDADPYEGQHIMFSIDPATTIWPTDTSLPFGQPRAGEIHVLD